MDEIYVISSVPVGTLRRLTSAPVSALQKISSPDTSWHRTGFFNGWFHTRNSPKIIQNWSLFIREPMVWNTNKSMVIQECKCNFVGNRWNKQRRAAWQAAKHVRATAIMRTCNEVVCSPPSDLPWMPWSVFNKLPEAGLLLTVAPVHLQFISAKPEIPWSSPIPTWLAAEGSFGITMSSWMAFPSKRQTWPTGNVKEKPHKISLKIL